MMSYYFADLVWSLHATCAFAADKFLWAIPVAVIGALISGTITLFVSGSRIAALSSLAGAVGAPIIVLAVYLVWHIVYYPVVRENDLRTIVTERDSKIAELGGATEPRIAIPSALRGTNDRRIASALGKLSDIVNIDMQRVCDEAKVALTCINQIRIAQPSDCASQTNTALTDGRTILNRLWASADTGFLVAGDPELLGVLQQAIQGRDRLQIFVKFDQYARGSYEQMRFLSLIADSPEERHRLFEAALNLSDSASRWSEATDQYCRFIKKTNERISQIRDQLARGR